MIAGGPVAGALGTRVGRTLPLRVGLALGALALFGLALAGDSVWEFVAWLPALGAGVAFALAAIGALVIDHSRPQETGVTSAMNTIMRASGAAIGAQLAATLGTPGGFLMAALGLVAALLPTLALATSGSSSPMAPPTLAGQAARP